MALDGAGLTDIDEKSGMRMPIDRLSGVITPLLTPFEKDGSVAVDLYVEHVKRMLECGSDYVSPFGTTGEASSLTAVERRELLEHIVVHGVARADQLMPGTGLCALEETVELTAHAVDLGVTAVMILPPFYFPNPGDEGLYRYYSELIEKISSDQLRMCLYHIPQNTGVGISASLAARLNRAFPATVVAYKDSSGDWDNTLKVMESAPAISVFPASESLLSKAIALGAGGCISATCNFNVGQIKRVYELAKAGASADLAVELPRLNHIRSTIQSAGLIPALKGLRARETNDVRWLNTRPPLPSVSAQMAERIAADLGFG